MRRRLGLALLIGLIGTPIAGYMLATDYAGATAGDSRHWWTPEDQALPLDQTEERFRLYLEDETLQQHLARSSLTALGKDGMAFFVSPDLIRVRLNNWDGVRAAMLESAVYSAFGAGACAACLVLGLVQFFREPRGPRRRASGAGSQSPRR